MDIESDLPQDYEQIPWSHLVPVQKDRSLTLAIAVIAVIVALVAMVLFVRRGPGVVPIVAATTSMPPGGLATTLPPVVPDSTAVAAGPEDQDVAAPRIYSEADLMAVLPPPEADNRLMALARAEWFVTDYFTVDGDGSLADGVNAAMPDVVDLPGSDGSAISYVEWARAVDVVDHLDGSFDVTVWFRTLVGDVDGGFSRTAVRAVEVRLVSDREGRLAVTDVPIVRDVEPLGMAEQWPAPAVPPQATVAEAAAALGSFGSEPELTGAGRDERGWRLLFSIGDASGLRFPIVVRPGGTAP